VIGLHTNGSPSAIHYNPMDRHTHWLLFINSPTAPHRPITKSTDGSTLALALPTAPHRPIIKSTDGSTLALGFFVTNGSPSGYQPDGSSHTLGYFVTRFQVLLSLLPRSTFPVGSPTTISDCTFKIPLSLRSHKRSDSVARHLVQAISVGTQQHETLSKLTVSRDE